MKSWYVIHTKARQERVASENLERQNYEVFTPMIRLSKRRRGRWSEVVEPLFPGYLFIHLDLEGQNTASIRSTRGVIGLVRIGSEPRSVPDLLVEGLVSAQGDRGGAISQEHVFQSGDPVEIVSGPLAGLRAVFLASSGEERALLLLELLGRSNPVQVSQHQLIPVR